MSLDDLVTTVLAIPVFTGLNPFVERRVDVFHEDYASLRSV